MPETPSDVDLTSAADARMDWEKFRSMNRDFIEGVRRDHPEIGKGRWQFECYDSYDLFVQMFPTAEDRRHILDRCWRTLDAIHTGVQWAREKADEICRQGSQALEDAYQESWGWLDQSQ